MNQYANVLNWEDKSIPHRLWIETHKDKARLCMKIVKDVEPEIITLDLVTSQAQVMASWHGMAFPVSSAFEKSGLFSQVRCLLNLADGCVIWAVNHIELPNGKKMSADKLAFIPNMRQYYGDLVAIEATTTH
ncbi:hypothetical protein QWZ04_16580 [Vibrio tapetis subsp. quintayensis]|uniref:hypothetical protein n=1 Tax=Vibrio tapetis TaxID=52443 RepID=UPI0025B31741|nr:hypothetical protein [Vibrio tapetis]MDN3681924.1 hypothetical protein [Vibrio tapetis subsp. quintayensis]